MTRTDYDNRGGERVQRAQCRHGVVALLAADQRQQSWPRPYPAQLGHQLPHGTRAVSAVRYYRYRPPLQQLEPRRPSDPLEPAPDVRIGQRRAQVDQPFGGGNGDGSVLALC